MKKVPVWAIILVVVIALYIGLALFNNHLRLEQASTVTAECEVVDKYYKEPPGSDRMGHYIVLSFVNEGKTFEETITVSEEAYWTGFPVGEKILCNVTYDDAGIIKIEVADTSNQ